MTSNKDFSQLIDLLVADGWRVRRTGSGHIMLAPPFVGRQIVFGATPGRGRAFQNACADVRRVYRAAGREPPM